MCWFFFILFLTFLLLPNPSAAPFIIRNSLFNRSTQCVFVPFSALLTQPPPIITQGPANQTLPLKSVAILPCKASGHSQPQISWLKDQQRLATSERYDQLASGALQINDLEKTDSGIYTCRAKNADGETTWSASVQVEGRLEVGR